MVTYCLGNIGSKRRLFRGAEAQGVISLDNDEVVADFLLNGKVYFVIGETPCGNMRVWEYLAYARALKTRLPLSLKAMKELCKKVKSKTLLSTKLKGLSRVEYRKIQLASKLDDDCRAVYVNFDGLGYSPKKNLEVKRLIKKWSAKWEIFVSFSDFRFVPKGAQCKVFSPDGAVVGMVRQRVRKVFKHTFKKALLRRNMTFKFKGIKQVVLSDN